MEDTRPPHPIRQSPSPVTAGLDPDTWRGTVH
jgi:hypothetical protein